MSKSNVKHKSATASDLAPVEQQRAVGLVRTRKIGRQTRTIGERALQTEPDAQQGNVEVVGGHQRSHHRQLCLQYAANSRVQHRRSELTGLEDRTHLRRPDDGSSTDSGRLKPTTNGKGLGFGTRALPIQPSNSQVTRRHRSDRVGLNKRTHQASAGSTGQLLLRTNTQLGRRLTCVSNTLSVRRSISRLNHFGFLCSQFPLLRPPAEYIVAKT